jgi:hypothetical protein
MGQYEVNMFSKSSDAAEVRVAEIPVAKSRNRAMVQLGRHLEKNLVAYVAAASATLLTASLPAEAEIIYTPSNTPMTLAHSNKGVVYTQLDLNNDGVPDFTFAMSSTNHFSSYGYTTKAKFFLQITPNQAGNQVVLGKTGPTASAVPAGVKIGPQEKFGSAGYLVNRSYNRSLSRAKSSGTWQPVEFAYVGLKILINGQVHYGWARIKFPYPFAYIEPSIYGYAYESTPNEAITTGQTSGSESGSGASEPASLGMLAGGAAAIDTWRAAK